jgi:OOP family OmpA-OmpF porin
VAGDPVGVNEALQAIKSNWAKAAFSIDVLGLTDNSVVIDGAVQVQYEALSPGYLAYLRVSSHGDIVGMHASQPAASLGGALNLAIQPPLGDERAVFLFSQRPLTALFERGQTPTVLGSDRSHADALVRRVAQLQSQGMMLAVRRIHYLVEAPAGQTQYTTRSIMRRMDAAAQSGARETPPLPTRIEFDFDSDHLTAGSRRDLDVFGAVMVARRDRKVTLEGHTDMIGTPQYNMDLSIRRAAAARLYLLESFGLTPSQLQITGKGAAGPIATNDTEEGRSQNRRVDFIFEGPARVGK